MSPRPPYRPRALGDKDVKERPDCRGLTFFQSLGLRRKAKAAKEAEFSKILAEAAEESAKIPRPVPAWDLHKVRQQAPTPTSESSEPLFQDLSKASSTKRCTLLDDLSLEAVEQLWEAIKAKSMRSAAAAKNSNSAGTGGQSRVETINLRDFLLMACKHLGDDEAARRLLEGIFQRIDHRGRGTVRTHDITTALVLVCRHGPEEKLRMLFDIFDADDDGCVTLDEIFDLFVSVKANDLARCGSETQAEITFGGELSLQEAKRLFELTVPHLPDDTDIIVFDDFMRAVKACPVVLPNFLPGLFSVEWLYRQGGCDSPRASGNGSGSPGNNDSPTVGTGAGQRSASKTARTDNGTVGQRSVRIDGGAAAAYASKSTDGSERKLEPFGRDVRKRFIATLRRGQEHLDLSSRLGRAKRIMHDQLNLFPPEAAEPESAKLEAVTPAPKKSPKVHRFMQATDSSKRGAVKAAQAQALVDSGANSTDNTSVHSRGFRRARCRTSAETGALSRNTRKPARVAPAQISSLPLSLVGGASQEAPAAEDPASVSFPEQTTEAPPSRQISQTDAEGALELFSPSPGDDALTAHVAAMSASSAAGKWEEVISLFDELVNRQFPIQREEHRCQYEEAQMQALRACEMGGEWKRALELLAMFGYCADETQDPSVPRPQRIVRVNYDTRDAEQEAELPESTQSLRLSGDASKRFRQEKMDEKTEKAYRSGRHLRGAMLDYPCVICSKPHEIEKTVQSRNVEKEELHRLIDDWRNGAMNHRLKERKHDPSEHQALRRREEQRKAQARG